jgi:hypothetical protein
MLVLVVFLLLQNTQFMLATDGNCAHDALANCLSAKLERIVLPSELVDAFPPPYRGSAAVPAHILSDVASKMGVELAVEQFNPKKPVDELEGAVLLLFAGTANGHYVFCKSVEADYVVLVDSLSKLPEQNVPTRQLTAIWDGTALVVSKRNPWLVLETLIISVVFATAIVFVGNGWFRNKGTRKLLCIFLVAVCSTYGCDSRNFKTTSGRTDSDSYLQFERKVVVLTDLVENGIPYEYRLKLCSSKNAPKGAGIKSVVATCSCIKVDGTHWTSVEAGGSQELIVHIDPEGKDVMSADVIVETNDGKICSVNVSSIVTTRFRPSASMIVHDYVPEKLNEGELSIFRLKGSGIPMSLPDQKTLQVGGSTWEFIEAKDINLGDSSIGGEQVKEVHRWRYLVEDSFTTRTIAFPYEKVFVELAVNEKSAIPGDL